MCYYSTSVLLFRGNKTTLTAISSQFVIIPLLSGQFPKSRGWPTVLMEGRVKVGMKEERKVK